MEGDQPATLGGENGEAEARDRLNEVGIDHCGDTRVSEIGSQPTVDITGIEGNEDEIDVIDIDHHTVEHRCYTRVADQQMIDGVQPRFRSSNQKQNEETDKNSGQAETSGERTRNVVIVNRFDLLRWKCRCIHPCSVCEMKCSSVDER